MIEKKYLGLYKIGKDKKTGEEIIVDVDSLSVSDKNRHYKLCRNFGITIWEFDELCNSQRGKCAICGKEETTTTHGKTRPLSVDHNHRTGAVRGLLCSTCNIGLGCFYDDPELLEKAIEYLNRREQ